jgi:hypothetical protein
VLLVSVPSVSRLDSSSPRDGWRFTPDVCRRLFSEQFGGENTMVSGEGSLATCIAFLRGMACEELSPRVLDRSEEAFPLVVTIRAVKRS